MLNGAFGLARATRRLAVVVLVLVVGLAGPGIAGWSSAVTPLAQADGDEQQPSDTAAPAVDESPPFVEETPASDATPVPDEAMPPPDDPAAPRPQSRVGQVCVSVTSDSNGKLTVLAETCPPDPP